MATKTAIAAKERQLKESIADKDRAENRRQFKKSHELATMRANYEGLEKSSNVVKNLSQAAFGKGGLASAMSENDPAWYKKFNLNSYSVNLPTFYRLGSRLSKNWRTQDSYDTVPGIAVLNFIPTIPNMCENPSLPNTGYRYSPLNQSLTRFMAELRKLNSRIGDYDPSDIGLYWYAISGIIYNLGRLGKALRFYNTYYAENRYFSKMCIVSCGFDADDFLANVPQYKARLMKWIDLFNANAVVPSSLDFLKRAFWIANVVVREHKTNCSQIYHFNPVVNVALDNDESYVGLSKIASNFTFTSFTSWMESSITELFNSVGVVTMTADLRAAFPDNKLLKYPQITGDEAVVYSESIHDLEQIHNLRTLPVTESRWLTSTNIFASSRVNALSYINIIVDNSGYLCQGIMQNGDLVPMQYAHACTNYDKLRPFADATTDFLNFYDSNYISDDAILEATRLRFVLSNQGQGKATFKYNGTEVITDIVLFTANYYSNTWRTEYIYTDTDNQGYEYVTIQQCPLLADASTFDWLPILTMYCVDDEHHQYTFGEIDHAVAITPDNLRIIHEGCAFSLFYVNDFGKNHVA